MQKIIINVCYGGFSVSDAAIKEYTRIKNIPVYPEPSNFAIVGTYYWLSPPTGTPQDNNRKQLSSSAYARDDPELVEPDHELGQIYQDGYHTYRAFSAFALEEAGE